MSASTSPVTPGAGASLQQRLSAQLESLSQVGELLTLRLLELEERLDGLELQLGQLQPGAEPEMADTGALLAATAERITRLEDLLTGGSPSEHPIAAVEIDAKPMEREAPQLEIVPDPMPELTVATGLEEPAMAVEEAGFDEPELELHPFPDEEEEQPFMDELSA
jgi:hypothetical protein